MNCSGANGSLAFFSSFLGLQVPVSQNRRRRSRSPRNGQSRFQDQKLQVQFLNDTKNKLGNQGPQWQTGPNILRMPKLIVYRDPYEDKNTSQAQSNSQGLRINREYDLKATLQIKQMRTQRHGNNYLNVAQYYEYSVINQQYTDSNWFLWIKKFISGRKCILRIA